MGPLSVSTFRLRGQFPLAPTGRSARPSVPAPHSRQPDQTWHSRTATLPRNRRSRARWAAREGTHEAGRGSVATRPFPTGPRTCARPKTRSRGRTSGRVGHDQWLSECVGTQQRITQEQPRRHPFSLNDHRLCTAMPGGKVL
jgi:hypothetical protein